MNKLVEIKNLEISFQDFHGAFKAVRDVSFDIYEGEALALVGESGCGKSVTAKSLLGLIPEKDGSIAEKSEI